MHKVTVATVVLLFLTVTVAMPAGASSIQPSTIDFSGGTGGLVSYTPGVGNSLDITNAPISLVSGFWNSSKYSIVGGILDLITGGCVTGCTINGKTGSTNDTFADGGSIEIFGGIPSLGIPAGTLLLEGFFDSALDPATWGFRRICSATFSTLSGTKHTGGMNGCVAVTDINTDLLAGLNFPTFKTSGGGYMSQMFLDLTLSLGTYTGSVRSTDILIHPDPEPATLALMGVGLLFVGTLTRKKLISRHSAPPVPRA